MNTDQLIALAEMNLIMLRCEGMKAENEWRKIRNGDTIYCEDQFAELEREMEKLIAHMKKGM